MKWPKYHILISGVASNIKLLSCYEQQRRLADTCYLDDHRQNHRLPPKNSLVGWWLRLSTVEQTYTCIITGLALQVC